MQTTWSLSAADNSLDRLPSLPRTRGEHNSGHKGEIHRAAAEEQKPEAAALQAAAPEASGQPEQHGHAVSF